MAPFGVLTIAFCMVFQGATLIFSTPGARFLAPGPDSGPGPPNWGPGRNLELGTPLVKELCTLVGLEDSDESEVSQRSNR